MRRGVCRGPTRAVRRRLAIAVILGGESRECGGAYKDHRPPAARSLFAHVQGAAANSAGQNPGKRRLLDRPIPAWQNGEQSRLTRVLDRGGRSLSNNCTCAFFLRLKHIRVIYYDVADPFWGQKLLNKVAENILSAIENPSEAIFKTDAENGA